MHRDGTGGGQGLGVGLGEEHGLMGAELQFGEGRRF